MALVKQLGDDSWLVVCTACCHMALVFAMTHLHIFQFLKNHFCPFFFFISFFLI